MARAVESAGRFALPEQEGLGLCRTLGLAISNISMYGMEHSVAATSVTQAFDALVSKTDLYGEIEFVLGDAGLMVNGSVVVTERSTGQLLVDQITKLGVHDFVFVPPINRAEFTQFVLILAASPGSTAVADGFEEAIAKAELKSVRVANVSYARVDKNAPPPTTTRSVAAAATGGARAVSSEVSIVRPVLLVC